MNEAPTQQRESEAGPRLGNKSPSSRLLAPLVSIGVGACIGILFAKSGKAAPFSPGPLFVPMFISMGLWVVLSVYWELAARNTSATKSSESGGSRAAHLLMANGAVILSFWPFAGWPNARWAHFEFPRVLPSVPYLPLIGVVLATCSLLLALWARRRLGRNWSGAVTVKQDHELVRSGPYRYIRHPIYTGAIGMHFGTALISGRLQGLLAVALILLAYARKIRMEERILGEVFGASFEEYRRESWALVPWLF